MSWLGDIFGDWIGKKAAKYARGKPPPALRPTGLPGDYTYGLLNDISRPNVRPVLDWAGYNPWKAAQTAFEKLYAFDALSNTGPYRGIVLRIEAWPQTETDMEHFYEDTDDATHYIYTKDSVGVKPPSLVKVKVRVPELHAHLPIPEEWGDIEKGTHHAIIELYPTYVAQSDMIPAPTIGDVVWVDYTNKNDFTDPIYLRPVQEMQYFPPSARPYSAKERFDCWDTTPGSPAGRGDSAPWKNSDVNLNLPKGAHAEPTDDKIDIVEGGDPNTPNNHPAGTIKQTLEKLLADENLPVRGWVGSLASNDDNNVIILAPKTTDFSKRLEIIYYFHGASSWFTSGHGLKRRQTPRFLIENMSALSKAGRNFVLVHPQMPWSRSDYDPKAPHGQRSKFGKQAPNKMTTKFDSGFEGFHTDVLSQLAEMRGSSAAWDIFITMSAHSKGGHALANIAKSGAMKTIKPDKITCADADYRFGSKAIWDKYLKSADKPVEWNLIALNPDRCTPPKALLEAAPKGIYTSPLGAEDHAAWIGANKPGIADCYSPKPTAKNMGHIPQMVYRRILQSITGDDSLKTSNANPKIIKTVTNVNGQKIVIAYITPKGMNHVRAAKKYAILHSTT